MADDVKKHECQSVRQLHNRKPLGYLNLNLLKVPNMLQNQPFKNLLTIPLTNVNLQPEPLLPGRERLLRRSLSPTTFRTQAACGSPETPRSSSTSYNSIGQEKLVRRGS